MRQFDKASTGKILYFFAQDTSSATGGGLTGLAFNSSGLTCYFTRTQGSATAVTLVTQTVTGSWSSGGFVEVDATNQPGLYRFDPPDAGLATGADFVFFYFKGATNLAPVMVPIELMDINVSDRTYNEELSIEIAKLLDWNGRIEPGEVQQVSVNNVAIAIGYAAEEIRSRVQALDPE